MTSRNKTRLIFFLSGALIGIICAAGGGVVVYKYAKAKQKPARYVASDDKRTGQDQHPGTDRPVDQKPLSEGYEAFVASSLDRYFKDGNTLLKPLTAQSAEISAAKNEYETFQVVIQNGRDPLSNIRLTFSDLMSGNGHVIDKSHLSWREVGYVPTITPYYPVKYVGDWPDPLMPVDQVSIEPGMTQPLWVTMYVPAETPAGTYRGTIDVLVEGEKEKSFPLNLKVYDFQIPQQRSLKTAFDFYGHETHTRYPRGKNETKEAYSARINDINHKFIIELLKYRVDPVLNVDPTNDYELANVDRYLRYGLSNFSIGRRGGTLGNNWPYDDIELEALLGQYRTYGEILALNKMLDYTYIYTWDEGKIGNPQVAKVTNMIHRAHPKLKNMVAYHGYWNPDEHPGWGDDIDIWTVQISSFNEKMHNRLRDLGMEMWLYVSGPSGDGTPNLAMDFDSVDYRIIPWLCWRYNFKGFLYWCVNWWVQVDPFLSAHNTKWQQNGNGLLLYPGEDGPIGTLRMEIFRDGMEDYEYLTILKKLVALFEKEGLSQTYSAEIEKARELLRVENDIVQTTRSYTRDKALILQRRNQVAVTIELLSRLIREGQA